MKKTTPLWLLNKLRNSLIDAFVPFKTVELDGLKFRYLRRDEPPQNSQELSSKGLEFYLKIEKLSGNTAVDVGANIGSYTLRLAQKFREVIAFEPSPLFSKVLRTNVRLNDLRNVRIKQIALSDFNGSDQLYIKGGATSLNPSHYGLRYRKSEPVNVSRLDDFEASLKNLDFIKIDVEGEENKVLRGARNVIDIFRPIIAIEVHNGREVSRESCGCNTCLLVKSLGYQTEVTGEFSSVGQVHWVWGTPLLS